MRLLALVAIGSIPLLTCPGAAHAAPTPEDEYAGASPARTGFQMALRTGFSFPMGNATGVSSDTLSRRYAWQIPIAIDLGAKVRLADR